jgi:hypothetical protein
MSNNTFLILLGVAAVIAWKVGLIQLPGMPAPSGVPYCTNAQLAAGVGPTICRPGGIGNVFV